MNSLREHLKAVNPVSVKEMYYKPQRIHYTRAGFVYYLRVEHEALPFVLYKIGFSLDVYKRMYTLTEGKTGVKVSLVACVRFKKAVEANKYEQGLHRKFSNSRYRGMNVLNSGNSELYVGDILGLDGT